MADQTTISSTPQARLSLAEFSLALEKKDQVIWCPLTDYRFICVEGPDASKFLQGQLTCDLNSLVQQRQRLCAYGAHCNPKGRIISNFILLPEDERTWLLKVHASIADVAIAALKKYIVFSRAQIFFSDQYRSIGFAGTYPQSLSQESSTPFPETDRTFNLGSEHILLRHSTQQWEMWCPNGDANMLASTCNENNVFSEKQWNLLNIRRGYLEIQKTSLEKFLPQEINLQQLDGVSFSKGCYTGQEIVARMHYKGKLKKHMRLARFCSTQAPHPGMDLINSASGKVCGSIILASPSGTDLYDSLVICADDAVTENNVCLSDTDHSKLQWLTLPYAITN